MVFAINITTHDLPQLDMHADKPVEITAAVTLKPCPVQLSSEELHLKA